MATGGIVFLATAPPPSLSGEARVGRKAKRQHSFPLLSRCAPRASLKQNLPASPLPRRGCSVLACLPPPSASPSPSSSSSSLSKKLYVSGLSFRTTEESLRNAFKNFGQLVEVNLVMDKIANRPRGFAFLRYATEEEAQSAIEGMHGKFLDGRVIFVEVAKPRSELRQIQKQNPR
ncbi:organelle RRM domain-containing protein 6, chloroplastic isoform X1 [Syzygium oleosum]|uniref:organelle RRM domain-containing protein 6, chloroplastic isoform X1 n=1 Tax=Syzygium oleosum TaxID=219896 RepID=UPI0011D2B498|nr:organelle RRM domain-containing protein 6, chloroplastic isoform X1 [Syzygium oleosum]